MPDHRPDIVIIMTDQQRADFFASRGFGIDTMPYLDSLAQRGVRFAQAYTSMPICVPARISLLTGRFPKAHGVIANWPEPAPRYGQDLPDLLREAGYTLGLFGKNHSHLTANKFDTWRLYDHTAGPPRPGHESEDAAFDRWMVNLGHWVSSGPTPFPLDCQYPVRIVSDALAWLEQLPADRPVFMLVSFPEPHSPYQVPEPYYSLFPPDKVPPPRVGKDALRRKNFQWIHQYETIRHFHPQLDAQALEYRSRYCGMLRLLDDQIRRLVEYLERSRRFENTLFLFVSDHGEFCGDYGLYRKGLALPEVSIRIPMVWFGGPVRARASEHPALASIVDVLPTICDAIGVPVPPGVQGRSLWPLLTGDAVLPPALASVYVEHGIGGAVVRPSEPRRFDDPAETLYVDGVARTNFDGTLVATSGYRRAVIAGRWKLVYDLELPPELYDLSSDPYELVNLANEPAVSEVLHQMERLLLWWSVRLDDNLGVQRYQVATPPHGWYCPPAIPMDHAPAEPRSAGGEVDASTRLVEQ